MAALLPFSIAPMSLQDRGEVISLGGSGMLDCGDFVMQCNQHEVEDYTEPVQLYDLGLFYPICIGEVLVQRYRIEHKLGQGGFSTVWLARDIQEKNVAFPGKLEKMNTTCRTKLFVLCRTLPIFSHIRAPFSFLAAMVLTGS
jgi:hypothetical protein